MRDRPDILREYRVTIVPADKAGPQPGYPDNLGLRTNFGGVPDVIQGAEDEDRMCPRCRRRMHSVAQIDSFEFNGNNNPHRKEYGDEQFMFGDVGIIYVWFCFDCLAPHAETESY
jgi:hypothetical protein